MFQDTVEFYLLFFVIYALLVPVQLYAVTHQRHPVTRLFTTSLLLEFLGITLNLLNSFKFALDGIGYPRLAIIGDVLDILSRVRLVFFTIIMNDVVQLNNVEWHLTLYVSDNIYVITPVIGQRLGRH